ncbi:TOG/XMAP215 microtubule plus end tracking polymerase Alp14 [Schizosaccharomyces pombe]|uniref:Spindle pole body component alp14 n=1 Tax=Schizosaccharomyces pombe (strain 972 / ATCC 24843) TaxID=284812 RepID=ALP14_SCHPO|nr:microtubule polymerase alp14 [Schizosaccharomyces pombe]O94534.1 RecName: Full=Spindle pole body component alp14; AltName: Full=Altered polarity protein 14 [Schizosaccharomyces pombe 972h-]BAA84527.1 Alp14 [Schizosaccharomyces pombe]CAA22843.1 TOG ortholog Alp14 [Schizosaccharomyces pombe]|eukprot:NP_588048.1 microtubule polymerase alp14 [Schizosaccharomyces pombe]
MSQDQEEDYSKLPLESRIVHKVWKVRLSAYEECSKSFSLSADGSDNCFELWNNQSELWKSVLTDSNVAAQEAGTAAFVAYCRFSDPSHLLKAREISVLSISEKCLTSPRAGTRENALEALMLLVEADSAAPVIESIIPSLSARSPKVIASNVAAIASLVEQFGAKVIPSKMIIPHISNLFGHADKNVRKEASRLTVNIYRWTGDPLKDLLFKDLRPVQTKELESLFAELPTEPPKQTRFLKSQQPTSEPNVETQVEEQPALENEESEPEPSDDQFDLVEEVDVLPNVDPNLETLMASSKWKDRKEALDKLLPVLSQPKIKDNDFFNLVAILTKSVSKDANIMVVINAAHCIQAMAKGLRSNFSKYASTSINALLERSKEKKANVIESLSSAMDAVLATSSLDDLAELIASFAGNKNPQIKSSCFSLFSRSFSNMTSLPSKFTVDTCAKACVPGVSDTFEPVRSAAAEALGVLMKLVGERAINQYLSPLDDIRKSKIRSFYETATVKAKAPTKKSKVKPSKQEESKVVVPSNAKAVKKSVVPSSPVVPSPRKATNKSLSMDVSKGNAFENGPLLPRPTTRPVSRGLSRGTSSSLQQKVKASTPLNSGALNETVQNLKNMELDDPAPQPAKHSRVDRYEHPKVLEDNDSTISSLESLKRENEELREQLKVEHEENISMQKQLSELKGELNTLRSARKASPIGDRKPAFMRRANTDFLELSTSPSFQRSVREFEPTRPKLYSSIDVNQRSPLASAKTNGNFTFHAELPRSPFSSRANNINPDWTKAIDLAAKLKQKITEMKQTDQRHQGLIH